MFWDLLLALALHVAPLSIAPAALAPPPGASGGESASTLVAGSFADSSRALPITDETSFRVRFGDAVSGYRVMAMFALPGEPVAVAIESSTAGGSFALRGGDGGLVSGGS